MRGPFSTKAEAEAAAGPGEHILARNERYFPGAAWCVMPEVEWDRVFHRFGNEWTHWETKK